MSSISPNSPPRSSSAQSALKEATQNNTHATPQGASGNTFTMVGPSLSGGTEALRSLLPIPQPTRQKLSLAEQRWKAWINARDISPEEQEQRQALTAKHGSRIEFSDEQIIIQDDLECEGFTSLPAGLVVGGHLSIENCPDLTSLPEGLDVESYLWIENCPDLTSLPAAAGLKFKGGLWIENCPNLTSLPAGLKVLGNLSINNCPDLANLPESLVVDSDLWIKNCPGFTSLPLSILQMPLRSDGQCRKIYLTNTGITDENRSHIEAWLAKQPNRKWVQLHWS